MQNHLAKLPFIQTLVNRYLSSDELCVRRKGKIWVQLALPQIDLFLAVEVLSTMGNHSRLCMYNELLMKGLLSTIKELCQLKFRANAT